MAWSVCPISKIPNNGPLCHTRDWLMTCMNIGETPLILRHGIKAIAFSIKRRGARRVLELLGAEMRSQAGLIGPLDKGIPILSLDALPCHVDLIDLRRLPASQVNYLFPELQQRIIRPDEACYSCHITEDYNLLWKSFSKKFKQNLRTAKNRVRRQLGDDALVVKDIEVTDHNWFDLLGRCKKISSDSWQGKTGVSVFGRGDRLVWLKKILSSGFSHRIFFLVINSHDIAVCWFIEKFPNTLLYIIEYKQKWKKISPGNLLLNQALQYYCDKHYTFIDFGYGESQYKKNWCNIYTPLVRLMIPLNLAGKIMTAYQILRWKIGDNIRQFKINIL